MFSVHQRPGFKSQEATNEVKNEQWSGLSLAYSQDVQAFTRKIKERRGIKGRTEKGREEKRRREKWGEGRRMERRREFCSSHLIDAVSPIKSLVSDWIH